MFCRTKKPFKTVLLVNRIRAVNVDRFAEDPSAIRKNALREPFLVSSIEEDIGDREHPFLLRAFRCDRIAVFAPGSPRQRHASGSLLFYFLKN